MPSKFHSAVHKRGDVTYLKIAGVIDEDNELTPLAEQMAPGTLVIDLAEIDRINSCGVRDWVNWLGRVEKSGSRIVLVECSPSIVAQVNLVNNFTGTGVVKSFYAPYFCPSCDREKVLLIETRDAVGVRPYKAPICRCDECDGPMDFDDMEESYFAFLGNSAKIATDARVDDVVTEFTPSDGAPKLRTRAGHSAPGGGAPTPTPAPGSAATVLSSLPSVPSLPSLKKLATESYSSITTGRHVLSPAGAIQSGRYARSNTTGPVERTTTLPAPASFIPVPTPILRPNHAAASSRGLLLLFSVLLALALATVVYLFVGQASGNASTGTPSATAPK